MLDECTVSMFVIVTRKHKTTQFNKPEDQTLNTYWHGNLKFYILGTFIFV
jgi:hypothetical protein